MGELIDPMEVNQTQYAMANEEQSSSHICHRPEILTLSSVWPFPTYEADQNRLDSSFSVLIVINQGGKCQKLFFCLIV